MSTPSISDVEALLDRVIPHVVVQARDRRNSLLTVDQYQQILDASRHTIDLMARVNALRFEPSIETDDLRQALTSSVGRALAPHVEGGTIQIPLIRSAGIGNPRSVDAIVTKLLDLAILHGNRRAAEIFCGAVDYPVVSFSEYFMLEGIAVGHRVPIFEGVWFESLPPARRGIPPPLDLLPTDTYGNSEDYFSDAVLLVVDWTTQPRFIKPSIYLAQQGSHGVFQSRRESQDVPEFDHEDLARAMSLTVCSHVHASMCWIYVSPDEITNPDSRGVSGYSWMPGRRPRSTPTVITDDHINNAKDLYKHIVGLDPKQRDKMIVPIDRLAKSFDELNDVDRTIDLAITLECLFLDGIEHELQFRLAVRAAKFLADDLAERKEIVKGIKDFYKLRSRAAHTGRTDADDNTDRLLDRTTELCCQAVTKILAEGQPVWDLIDVG